jgi:glycerol-3-phosphate acyltransferase PlsY
MWLYYILFPVASYIIGSIPFGVLISRGVAQIDITQKGSGNIGATNVTRELGIKWGFLTLVMDILKGFFPVFLCSRIIPDFGIGLSIVGLAAFIGHQFSLFQRFRGGKGVATVTGIYLAVSPIPVIIALVIFIIVLYKSDFVSLGSMISVSSMPILFILFKESRELIISSLIIAAMICISHKDNIQRLIRGEENRWRKRSVTSEGQEDE